MIAVLKGRILPRNSCNKLRPPEGGGVLRYFHTYVGLGHFFGLEFSISIFLGVFRKINIFWGMKILQIFLESSRNCTIFRGYFYAFKGLFLWSLYRKGIFLGVAKISNIFLGCSKFLIFFGVKGRCWARAYV